MEVTRTELFLSANDTNVMVRCCRFPVAATLACVFGFSFVVVILPFPSHPLPAFLGVFLRESCVPSVCAAHSLAHLSPAGGPTPSAMHCSHTFSVGCFGGEGGSCFILSVVQSAQTVAVHTAPATITPRSS
jgi:hypothetical protein